MCIWILNMLTLGDVILTFFLFMFLSLNQSGLGKIFLLEVQGHIIAQYPVHLFKPESFLNFA